VITQTSPFILDEGDTYIDRVPAYIFKADGKTVLRCADKGTGVNWFADGSRCELFERHYLTQEQMQQRWSITDKQHNLLTGCSFFITFVIVGYLLYRTYWKN
jgi:hypothetical protein